MTNELVNLNDFLFIFAKDYHQWWETRENKVQRLLSAYQASEFIIPTQFGEEFDKHVVVKTCLDVLIIFEGATQNGDNKVEHQHGINQ